VSRRAALLGAPILLALVLVLALRLGKPPNGERSASTGPGTVSLASIPPPATPSPSQITRASSYAGRRHGAVSFAVVGTSGALACYRCRIRYHSASVVKAMLLVAYLDTIAGRNEVLTADHEAFLRKMIRVSDNEAASAIYAHVGSNGLREIAERAGMADFAVGDNWGSARITAADQARLFSQLPELTDARYLAYVRTLLSSVAPKQSWGIPSISRPEWQTFFKGGWLTSGRGNLVHQAARLEKGDRSLAIVILTDRNPSDEYGRATIAGITRRLLGSRS
jgi:hypothetical protein